VAETVLARSKSRKRYIEPFVGSGAVWVEVAPYFEEALGSDLMPDAVMYLNALREGWIPPTRITDPQRDALRDSDPSPLRGFVGFCCGFRGKFFLCNVWPESEVPRISAGEAKRGLRFKQCPPLRVADYRSLDVQPGDLVYCDPPYFNTTGYTWVGTGSFDTYEFWAKMAEWVRRGAIVLVSEEDAPNNWAVAQEQIRSRTTSYNPETGKNGSKNAVERIFIHESQVEDRGTLMRHRVAVASGRRSWPAIE
jgi:DNA adenine methylase